MPTMTCEEAGRLLRLHPRRVQRLARQGRLPASRIGRKWLFRSEDLEALLGVHSPGPAPAGVAAAPAPGRVAAPSLAISARNRLRGTVTQLHTDTLMAEVHIRIGDQDLVAVITRASAERLGLAVGEKVCAVIKATEIMVGREEPSG